MPSIPTMSSRGWAKTPEDKIDNILIYYQSLNPSMTLLFNGNVHSLQHDIQAAGGNMVVLGRIVQRNLTYIFSNNFPEGASVEVNVVPIGDNDARYNIEISASVYQNGRRYDISKAIEDIKSRFIEAFDVQQRVN